MKKWNHFGYQTCYVPNGADFMEMTNINGNWVDFDASGCNIAPPHRVYFLMFTLKDFVESVKI